MYYLTCDRHPWREFPHQRALDQHIRDSPDHWLCPFCGEDTESHNALQEHYESDHAVCRCCNEVFEDQWDVRQHYRDEHYYCEDCDRPFASQDNYDQVSTQMPCS